MIALKVSLPWPTGEGVYGKYASLHYARQKSRWVQDGFITLYYSYATIVAFRDASGLHVHENSWGTTTGKHLNWLSTDKEHRLPAQEFRKLLTEAIERNETLKKLSHTLAETEQVTIEEL